ncbi:unnamed protein product [Ixodes persulcatus]
MKKGSLEIPYDTSNAGLKAREMRVQSTKPGYLRSLDEQQRRSSARTQASLFSDDELDRYHTIHGASVFASMRGFAESLRRKPTDLDRYVNFSDSVSAPAYYHQPLLEHPYGTAPFPFSVRIGDSLDASIGRSADQERSGLAHCVKGEKPFHSEQCIGLHSTTTQSSGAAQSLSIGRVEKTPGHSIPIPFRALVEEDSKKHGTFLSQCGTHVKRSFIGQQEATARVGAGLSINCGTAWRSLGPTSITTPSVVPARGGGAAPSTLAPIERSITSTLATPHGSESAESSTSASTTSGTSSTSDEDRENSETTAHDMNLMSTSTSPSVAQEATSYCGAAPAALSARPLSRRVAARGAMQTVASQRSRGCTSPTTSQLQTKQHRQAGNVTSLRTALTAVSENVNPVVMQGPGSLRNVSIPKYIAAADKNAASLSSTAAYSTHTDTTAPPFTGVQTQASEDKPPLLLFRKEAETHPSPVESKTSKDIASQSSKFIKSQVSKGTLCHLEVTGGSLACNPGRQPSKSALLPYGHPSTNTGEVFPPRSSSMFKPSSSTAKRSRKTEDSLIMHLCVALNVILFSALTGIVFAYFLKFASASKSQM